VRGGNGEAYIAGYERGILGVENYWPVGDSLGFVRRIDAIGVMQWERVFDTSGTDLVDTIAMTPSGRIVVAGRTTGAFPGWSNAGQLDLFVGELSSDGDVLAFGQFGDERPQHAAAIAVHADDSFVIAGYDDVYVVGNAVHDWQDGFVAKFDVDGSASLTNSWWLQENSLVGDEATGAAAALDGSGDVFVARHNDGSPGHGGGIAVERISPDGALLWHVPISTISMDYIAGVVVSSAGRVYVAGTTLLPLYGPVLGDSDAFVTELDPTSGVEIWGRQLGSSQADWVSQLIVDPSGNVSITGSSAGSVVPGHISTGDDPFILSLTADGQPLGAWQGTQGAHNDDTYAIAPGVPLCQDWLVQPVS